MSKHLLDYASITSAPHVRGSNWLLLEAGDLEPVEAALEKAPFGRIKKPAKKLQLVAELEGAEAHYSKSEIARSRRGVPLPYEWLPGGLVVCAEPFVKAVDSVKGRYKAYPLELVHAPTKRRWKQYWLVSFVRAPPLALLRDDSEPVFYDVESTVLYAVRLRKRIQALRWPGFGFSKRMLPACRSVPVGTGPKADAKIRAASARAFLNKFPPVDVGDAYGFDWLLLELQKRWSDVTVERLQQALENDESIFIELDEHGQLDSVGARKRSALARKLSARR